MGGWEDMRERELGLVYKINFLKHGLNLIRSDIIEGSQILEGVLLKEILNPDF